MLKFIKGKDETIQKPSKNITFKKKKRKKKKQNLEVSDQAFSDKQPPNKLSITSEIKQPTELQEPSPKDMEEIEFDIFASSVPPLPEDFSNQVQPPPEIDENLTKPSTSKKLSKKRKRSEDRETSKQIKKLQPSRKKRKFSNVNELESSDRLSRTIKISNIPFRSNISFHPISTYQKMFSKKFKIFGEIESIRFRSIPIKKPPSAKFKKIPLFICIRKKYFAKFGRFVCFIVFKTLESTKNCLSKSREIPNFLSFENSTIFMEQLSKTEEGKTSQDSVNFRKVFVGNLPFDLTLEEFYELMKKKESLLGGVVEHIDLPKFVGEKDKFGNTIKQRQTLDSLVEKYMNIQNLEDEVDSEPGEFEKGFRNMGFGIITFSDSKCVDAVFMKKVNISFRGRHFKFRRFAKNKGQKKMKQESKNTKEKKNRKRDRSGQGKKKGEDSKVLTGEKGKKVLTGEKEWWMGEFSEKGRVIRKNNGNQNVVLGKKRRRKKRKR